MKNIYQPHYSYLLDASFKETPFNIDLNHVRPMCCGPSCKCTYYSRDKKMNVQYNEMSLEKLEPSSFPNFCKRGNILDINTFYNEFAKDLESEESNCTELMERLNDITPSIFRDNSILEEWTVSNFFRGIYNNGIIYHSGQLMSISQSSEPKIFVTKSTGNEWIDSYFLPYFLGSSVETPVISLRGASMPKLFHYGQYLNINSDEIDILQRVIATLISLNCCLIIEDSFERETCLSSIIGSLLDQKFPQVDVVAVSLSYDLLPKDGIVTPHQGWTKNAIFGYQNCGSLRVDFDSPFSLNPFIEHLFMINDIKQGDVPNSVLSTELSNHTFVSSYRNQRIMAVSFVAFALAFTGNNIVGDDDTISVMRYFYSLFTQRGYDFGFSGNLESVFLYGVNLLETRKVLKRLKNNQTLIRLDLKNYFLTELIPIIWSDILLYNSISSILDTKYIFNLQETCFKQKLNESLLINRAIWLDNLIEIRLLKPCEELESVLANSLDRLINEGNLNQIDTGIRKKYQMNDYLEEESRRNEIFRELEVSSHPRILETIAFYRRLIEDFMKSLYNFSHYLSVVESTTNFVELSNNIPSISQEIKDSCVATFIKLEALDGNSGKASLRMDWSDNSNIEKLCSSIFMYIR
ncbi:uncharacterized protein mino [Lepeophtheirus salmonis]|uniref:uncharacterized protein mino n=1 Tax=Lepeophtheirus salmonis TaxID=72036 RepID=UPI001AE55818|nr:uncharacterized protein LOC121123322 [Lepeophtheirus salmonis]